MCDCSSTSITWSTHTIRLILVSAWYQLNIDRRGGEKSKKCGIVCARHPYLIIVRGGGGGGGTHQPNLISDNGKETTTSATVDGCRRRYWAKGERGREIVIRIVYNWLSVCRTSDGYQPRRRRRHEEIPRPVCNQSDTHTHAIIGSRKWCIVHVCTLQRNTRTQGNDNGVTTQLGSIKYASNKTMMMMMCLILRRRQGRRKYINVDDK